MNCLKMGVGAVFRASLDLGSNTISLIFPLLTAEKGSHLTACTAIGF